MHYGLRVYQYAYPFPRYAEKIARLHYLEALVEKGGGVYSDLSAHFPGWVMPCLLRRDGFELFLCIFPEGTAGGRKYEPLYLAVVSRRHALEYGALFAVHRYYGTALFQRGIYQVVGTDDAFFVCKGNGFARFQRCKQRLHS